MKRICKDCGKTFELSDEEINYYKLKNWDLPKRCVDCRRENRRNSKHVVTSMPATNQDKSSKYVLIPGLIVIGVMITILAGIFIYTEQMINNLADSSVTDTAEMNLSDSSQDLVQENADEYKEEELSEAASENLVLEPDSSYSDELDLTEADIQYAEVSTENNESVYYTFRNQDLLDQHYQKHGIEMGFASEEAYVAAANAVICNPDSLHKLEVDDGDDIYYLEATNEFVVLSTDDYIRTYFCPDNGISYYNKQ